MILFLLALMLLVTPGPKGEIEVKNAWIRTGAKGMNSALYMDIVNHQPVSDVLTGVKTKLSKIAELHETYKKGDMMGMRKVQSVEIKSGAVFSFKPGGHHVMLIELTGDLKEGKSGEVILLFQNAGEVKVKAPVKKG